MRAQSNLSWHRRAVVGRGTEVNRSVQEKVVTRSDYLHFLSIKKILKIRIRKYCV